MSLLHAFVIAVLLLFGGSAFAADKPAPIAPMSVNINTANANTLAAALDGVGTQPRKRSSNIARRTARFAPSMTLRR